MQAAEKPALKGETSPKGSMPIELSRQGRAGSRFYEHMDGGVPAYGVDDRIMYSLQTLENFVRSDGHDLEWQRGRLVVATSSVSLSTVDDNFVDAVEQMNSAMDMPMEEMLENHHV